jgi:GH25 family lysozyme M1 (1,4-beta-N-acetylmuramidase)
MVALTGLGSVAVACSGAGPQNVASSSAQAVTNTQCMPATTLRGVDLNPAGNGTLDWSSASGSTSFAIIKATQGTSYTDSDFASNWAALKAAHIVRGAYHFFDATVSGVTQANYFLEVVGTMEPGDLPPTLDIECPVAGESDCLGNGSSGAASGSQITQAMNDFLNTVKAATGLTPIVYSFGSWFSDNGVDTTGLEAYPLWLADYSGTNCFNVPSPWSAPTIWQYDSSGTVAGVNVDDNYFFGGAAQLAAFTIGGSGVSTGGVDAGAPPPVDAGSPTTSCTVTDTGETGECIDTSACAALGNHVSTPGFCPGAANIECCTTATRAPPADAGQGPSDSSSGIPCSSDGDCNTGSDGSGMYCSGGFCVVGCNASWECPGNTTCVGGSCM